MKIRTAAVALALILAGTFAGAQTTDNIIDYQPVSCIVPDELTVFQMNVAQPGDLRAYFRLVNTTEWCWVQGNNVGKISTVVMPKFRPGQEIEYFFILLNGKRVIAKSPVLYRARAADHCDTLVARHSVDFIVDCSHEVTGTANSFVSGYGARPRTNERPPHISPDQPTQK